MEWNFLFFMNSALLGVGLAMDAFSVSLANGMNEKNMKKSRMAYIAGVYAFFQFLMPMIGWICVHTIVQVFGQFQKVHSVDRIDPASVYRRKHDQRICAE